MRHISLGRLAPVILALALLAVGRPAAAQTGLQGAWIAQGQRGPDQLVYFGADGLFFLVQNQQFFGGRYRVEGDLLILRVARAAGDEAILDAPVAQRILRLSPGDAFILADPDGASSARYEYVGAEHPAGASGPYALVGRYTTRRDGALETWSFTPDGWVFVQTAGQSGAGRWTIDRAGALVIMNQDGVQSRFPIIGFTRGQGFVLEDASREVAFRYLDGPFAAPPMTSPAPSFEQRQAARAVEEMLLLQQQAALQSAYDISQTAIAAQGYAAQTSTQFINGMIEGLAAD